MSKKIRTEAVDYLFSAILSLKDKEECYIFFEDICTINELLSLSQRFEVAKMLREHKTYLEIAEKTGCAIIPMSMNNTQAIFEGHLPFVRKTHVVLEYGKPIYPDQLDKQTRRHLGDYCHNIIQETIIRNQSLV